MHFGASFDASTRTHRAPLDAVEGRTAIPWEMAEMTDWDTCPAVERTPGKVGFARGGHLDLLRPRVIAFVDVPTHNPDGSVSHVRSPTLRLCQLI